MKTIYLAGGCFWGIQKFIDQFYGVIETEVGYANGPEDNNSGQDAESAESADGSDHSPTYEDVCNSSGHAETLKIQYDEELISLDNLLDYYFMVIDPVSINRQGNDIGVQYRTGIYYVDEEDLDVINRVYAEKEAEFGKAFAVEVGPLKNFYTAEEYHQKYLDKNPSGYCHIPTGFYRTNYKLLCEQIKGLAESSREIISLMSNASALLYEALPDINWAGFYNVHRDGDEEFLLVGPFQGKVACVRIAKGRGVCGMAWAEDETQLVPDVHEFPGHIACDAASNSEIVIPLHMDGRVIGVLDIDSPSLNRFTLIEKLGLESFVAEMERCLNN